MENIILVGASGHARVIVDIVEKQAMYRIAGFLDSGRAVGELIIGYEVLGTEADLPQLALLHDIKGIIIAIGDNNVRANVVAKITNLYPAAKFVSAIHPQAIIGKEVTIGSGTVVMAGAIVNPCCEIGEFCIVNTKASLDHDSSMGNFSSLAPGVTTGGNCSIGDFAAVGIGATIKHGVTVGEHSVIGGGSVVVGDVQAFSLNYGVPSKKIKNRTQGEKYL